MSSTATGTPQVPPATPPPQLPGKKNVWAFLRGLSWRAKIAFPLVLVGIGLVVYLTGKSATLKLTCVHNFRSGEIAVWTDDQLVYSGKLSAAKKRFGLFAGKAPLVGGKTSAATFTHSVKVPDGAHKLRVQVVGEGYNESRTIPVDFSPDTQSTVSVNALSHNLQVSWRDTQFTPSSVETPWYVRYAKALLITLFGSIISALMGMVVKEILEKLRPVRT